MDKLIKNTILATVAYVGMTVVNFTAHKLDFDNAFYQTQLPIYTEKEVKEWNDYACNVAFDMMDSKKMLNPFSFYFLRKQRPEVIDFEVYNDNAPLDFFLYKKKDEESKTIDSILNQNSKSP